MLRSPLRIATRGSPLALWQAQKVAELLEQRGQKTELLIKKTQGDKVLDRFLHEVGGKGLFVRELEEALSSGEADIAVHSMKDMPAALPPGLAYAAILERHKPTDVLVMKPGLRAAMGLSKGEAFLEKKHLARVPRITIGTASLRREYLLKSSFPDMSFAMLRGNIGTRLDKLKSGNWDGIIMAEAAIDRLELQHEVDYLSFNPDWFIPAPAQGAICIESLDKPAIKHLLAPLNHQPTAFAVEAERGLLKLLGGDCTMPFGAFLGVHHNGEYAFSATVLSKHGLKVEGYLPIMPEDNTQSLVERMLIYLQNHGLAQVWRGLKL